MPKKAKPEDSHGAANSEVEERHEKENRRSRVATFHPLGLLCMCDQCLEAMDHNAKVGSKPCWLGSARARGGVAKEALMAGVKSEKAETRSLAISLFNGLTDTTRPKGMSDLAYLKAVDQQTLGDAIDKREKSVLEKNIFACIEVLMALNWKVNHRMASVAEQRCPSLMADGRPVLDAVRHFLSSFIRELTLAALSREVLKVRQSLYTAFCTIGASLARVFAPPRAGYKGPRTDFEGVARALDYIVTTLDVSWSSLLGDERTSSSLDYDETSPGYESCLLCQKKIPLKTAVIPAELAYFPVYEKERPREIWVVKDNGELARWLLCGWSCGKKAIAETARKLKVLPQDCEEPEPEVVLRLLAEKRLFFKQSAEMVSLFSREVEKKPQAMADARPALGTTNKEAKMDESIKVESIKDETKKAKPKKAKPKKETAKNVMNGAGQPLEIELRPGEKPLQDDIAEPLR